MSTADNHPSPTDRAAKKAFLAALDAIVDVAQSARLYADDVPSAVEWLGHLQSLLLLGQSAIAHFDQPADHVHEPDAPAQSDLEVDAPTLAASEVPHAAQ